MDGPTTPGPVPRRPTPGQTVGPFFGHALPYPGGADLVPPTAAGAVRLHGTVFDGLGVPVPDALLEVWQTDAGGQVPQRSGSLQRDGATFTGWGRCPTDREGAYRFWTVEPARTDGAPFFAVTVLARGLLDRLFTRAYLPGPAAATDPLLRVLPEQDARALVCVREGDGSLRFDVHLQGARETPFLEASPR